MRAKIFKKGGKIESNHFKLVKISCFIRIFAPRI